MRCAILDTNVYIGNWEKGLYAVDLEAIRKTYVIRQSSVVLSELRRGEAGRLIREIGDAHGWETVKRQASRTTP